MSIRLERDFAALQAQVAAQAEVIARLEGDVAELQRLLQAMARAAPKGRAA